MPISPVDKIHYTRVISGILSGAVSGLLVPLSANTSYRGVLIATIFYIASYYIARYLLAVELSDKESMRFIHIGLGSYVFLWLFTWILYVNLGLWSMTP